MGSSKSGAAALSCWGPLSLPRALWALGNARQAFQGPPGPAWALLDLPGWQYPPYQRPGA